MSELFDAPRATLVLQIRKTDLGIEPVVIRIARSTSGNCVVEQLHLNVVPSTQNLKSKMNFEGTLLNCGVLTKLMRASNRREKQK